MFSRQVFVFGTIVELSLCGDSGVDEVHALDWAQQTLQGRHNLWHAWKPGGLERFNGAFAEGRAAPVDPDTRALLIQGREFERQSQGAFSPAIGALVGAWGFHTDEYPVVQEPPSREDVARLVRAAPSMFDLEFSATTVSSNNPVVSLDLGGLAKGAAVDEVILEFQARGISCAMVNAGGDLRAYGSHRDGRSWRVAVRNPVVPDATPLGVLEISGDESVFTSGNYLRYRADNRLHGHILDPRTGVPVEHVVSVTVVTDSGVVADAAATALTVAGREGWRRVAHAMGIKDVLMVFGDGTQEMTDTMKQRLLPIDE